MLDFTNTHFVDETLLTRYHQDIINFLSDTYLNKSGGTMNGRIDSCSIIPKTTDAYNLGYYTNYWNTAYINNIWSGYIIPKADNTYNLGSPSYYWQNAYINNICSGNIIPETDNDPGYQCVFTKRGVTAFKIFPVAEGNHQEYNSLDWSGQQMTQRKNANTDSEIYYQSNYGPSSIALYKSVVSNNNYSRISISPDILSAYSSAAGRETFEVDLATGDVAAMGNVKVSNDGINTTVINGNSITTGTCYAQLDHSSNAIWAGLQKAAVVSKARADSGVNYLWGCATTTANYWLGIGSISNALYFTYFTNNLNANTPINTLMFSGHSATQIKIAPAKGNLVFGGNAYIDSITDNNRLAKMSDLANASISTSTTEVIFDNCSGTASRTKIGKCAIIQGVFTPEKQNINTVKPGYIQFPAFSGDYMFICYKGSNFEIVNNSLIYANNKISWRGSGLGSTKYLFFIYGTYV